MGSGRLRRHLDGMHPDVAPEVARAILTSGVLVKRRPVAPKGVAFARLRVQAMALMDALAVRIGTKPESYVYVIGCAMPGRVKIGKAADVAERAAAIQICSPIPLLILAILPDPGHLEAELHRRFARHRLHGEWFDLPPDELTALIGAVTS